MTFISEISEVLKSTREMSGVSLEEVSKDLEIPVLVLTQLEEGNIGAFKDIFDKFRFHKINFFVILGNPTEKHYDKIVEKCGGRVVGIYKQDVKLIDNRLYDIKVYEITRTDYYTKQAADLIKKLGNTV